jgi:hypothetical protein
MDRVCSRYESGTNKTVATNLKIAEGMDPSIRGVVGRAQNISKAAWRREKMTVRTYQHS